MMKSSESVDDVDVIEIIKKSKELLDAGALTENEFNKIKSIYLKQTKGPNNVKKSTNTSTHNTKIHATMGNKNKLDKEKFDKENQENQKFKVCPHCGKKIPLNAVRCKYCKTMLKTYSKEDQLKNIKTGVTSQNQLNDIVRDSDLKICPNCSKEIPINAIRCKYCKTMLKTYPKNKSSYNANINKKDTNQKKKTHDDSKNVLDKNLQKLIENNLDDVCRIFSIPNLGKKFVINKLCEDFTPKEISSKLNDYLNKTPKESPAVSRVKTKRDLLNNKIKPIPEIHFKIYFLINDMSFKSKDKFIKYITNYWGINDINRFYEKYTSLLKNGIQKQDFEKVMAYDIKETSELFSISFSGFGNRFVINRIFNKYSYDEIKKRLDSHFNLSVEFLSEIEEVSNKNKNKKITFSSKPTYYEYKSKTNILKNNFLKEKQITRDLIEKCFPAPQMTNSKFNAMVDECSILFNKNFESIMLILDSTTEYSLKLENEIKSDIKILNEIINKLDSLQEELLIIKSDDSEKDADILFEEMDDLIESVQNYKK